MTIRNEIEGRNLPRNTYEVTFQIDVATSSPELAATMARDRLLDPELVTSCDVHAIEWHKEAEDWLPNYKQGWYAAFNYGPRGGLAPLSDRGNVRPSIFFATETIAPRSGLVMTTPRPKALNTLGHVIEAMSQIADSVDHLNRVIDCLEGSKETDIQVDLECARNYAQVAVKILNAELERDKEK